MPHPLFSALGVGATLVLLAGCDGASDMIEQPSGEPQSVVSESEGIRLTLQSDKPEYELGEPVTLTFEVKNISDVSRTFEFSSACQNDSLVHQGDELVWSLGHDLACAQVLTSIMLEPGETWASTDIWDQRSNKGDPVSPGAFDATARLTPIGKPLESDPLSIVIR